MLKHRVIPTLLLKQGGLVKTTKFKKPVYVGDPINAVRIFNEKEVDELIVLDIDANKEGKSPDYSLIGKIAGECFMPFAYGGGIRTIEQAERIFALGVEKISLQTMAFQRPGFITELAEKFGSSSIIVSLDIKRDWLGKAQIFRKGEKLKARGHWLDLMTRLVDAGAGEVLLNSVDRDGTLSGPDLGLINAASKAIDVPMIAVGGISSLSDIKDAVSAGASAVAAGSFFVFYGSQRAVLISYPEYSKLEATLIDKL